MKNKNNIDEREQKERRKRKNDYYGVLCDCELELRAVKFDHYIIISLLLFYTIAHIIVVISREKIYILL